MGYSFEEGTYGFMMFNTPVVHAVAACKLLGNFTPHGRGTIELIENRFFCTNDKFYAIVDNLQIPVSDEYLDVGS